MNHLSLFQVFKDKTCAKVQTDLVIPKYTFRQSCFSLRAFTWREVGGAQTEGENLCASNSFGEFIIF